MVCVRRAWLTLGTATLALEDRAAGYVCTELDLGYPEIREVVENKPAPLDGVDDRTSLFASRALAASITAQGGTATVDQIGALFAPFMRVDVRPQLHYVLDRPGTPERVVTVRASDYTWAISGSTSRDIHLGWVAADPIMRDPTVQTAIAMVGSANPAGRVYPLTFNRTYPANSAPATTGTIRTYGDVAVRPVLRFYGPLTSPYASGQVTAPPAPMAQWMVAFVTGFRIDPGHYVDVDTAAKTAVSDTGASVMSSVDWQSSVWPVIPPDPAWCTFVARGSSTNQVSQVVASWSDGYLT